MNKVAVAKELVAIAKSLTGASKFVEGDLVVIEKDGKKVETEVVDVSMKGGKWVYKVDKSDEPVFESDMKRAASSRIAAARGPVWDAIESKWNDLHDLESNLEKASREYDMAASYPGAGAAEAKKMVQHIDRVKAELEKISFKSFAELEEAERAFVKKFGTPDEFAESERRRIFPI